MLGERFRRGKLYKARMGQYVANVAPYGYRYVPKQDGCPGHLVIDEAEAANVRMLYRWLVDEQLTDYNLEVTATRHDEIEGRAIVNVLLQPTFSIDFVAVTLVLQ